jgi:pre-rRNA-processing protein TSR4
MCTAGQKEAAEPVTAEPSQETPADAEMKRSLSSDSVASSATSASSVSSCSTSFSGRDPEWYFDVVLGFAEPPATAADTNADQFSSKVGGRPVWLYRGARPPPSLQCGRCASVLAFLLQLYAPIEENDAAFHRCVYLFICRASGCAGGSGSARVLTAQLPRRNCFYSYDAGDDGEAARATPIDGSSSNAADAEEVVGCALCGCAATAYCGRCKDEWYCSRGCQSIDWRVAHRDTCQGGANSAETRPVEDLPAAESERRKWLFKEFQIVNEGCPTPGGGCSEHGSDRDASDNVLGTTQQHGKKHQDAKSSSKTSTLAAAAAKAAGIEPSLQDASAEELPNSLFRSARRQREDSAFRRFSEMMRDAPDQIVRYWRGGRPLWAARGGRPSGDTQTCKRCGGSTIFEFQALPQLLYVLGVDAGGQSSLASRCGGLDFGTIAIFSCAAACGAGPTADGGWEYIEEIAHVQKIEEDVGAEAASAAVAASGASDITCSKSSSAV